jgi:hypothetical protein
MRKSPEWRLELLGSFSFMTINNAITSINSLTIIIKKHMIFFFILHHITYYMKMLENNIKYILRFNLTI